MNLEKRIRVIPYEKIDAGLSMSIDSALLDQMGNAIKRNENVDPVLRIYSFSSPTVVLGYNQKIEGRFNPEIAAQRNVKLTIRDSGGGHMYFGTNDLQFSFISPGEIVINGPKLVERYHQMNSVISQVLKELGYDATLGKTSIRIKKDGEKLVAGTAIRQKNNAYLHQIGILTEDYDNEIFELLMARPDEVEKWKSLVTSLYEHKKIDPSRIYNGILNHLGEYYLDNLTEEEMSDAINLNQNRYSNEDFIRTGTKNGDVCLIAGEKSDKNKEERVYA